MDNCNNPTCHCEAPSFLVACCHDLRRETQRPEDKSGAAAIFHPHSVILSEVEGSIKKTVIAKPEGPRQSSVVIPHLMRNPEAIVWIPAFSGTTKGDASASFRTKGVCKNTQKNLLTKKLKYDSI